MNRLALIAALVLACSPIGCQQGNPTQPSAAAATQGTCAMPASAPAGTAQASRVPAFPTTNTSFDGLVAEARSQGKPAVLYFCASWCGYCVRMNDATLTQPRVAQALAAYPRSHYDPDTEAGRAVAARFGVRGFPTMVIVDGTGRERGRIVGYNEADAFLAQLARY